MPVQRSTCVRRHTSPFKRICSLEGFTPTRSTPVVGAAPAKPGDVNKPLNRSSCCDDQAANKLSKIPGKVQDSSLRLQAFVLLGPVQAGIVGGTSKTPRPEESGSVEGLKRGKAVNSEGKFQMAPSLRVSIFHPFRLNNSLQAFSKSLFPRPPRTPPPKNTQPHHTHKGSSPRYHHHRPSCPSAFAH